MSEEFTFINDESVVQGVFAAQHEDLAIVVYLLVGVPRLQHLVALDLVFGDISDDIEPPVSLGKPSRDCQCCFIKLELLCELPFDWLKLIS